VVFGFVGLIGVYNDLVGAVRAFNRFLLLKLGAMVITMVADYWELRKCDSWMQTPEYLEAQGHGGESSAFATSNLAMDGLAKENVCPWARWAYLIGFAIDFAIAAYFAYKCLQYEHQIQLPYWQPLDFGEKQDASRKWLLYGVKDPRTERSAKSSDHADHSKPPEAEDPEVFEKLRAHYGSMANYFPYEGEKSYGPDGLEEGRAPAPLPPPPPRQQWRPLPPPPAVQILARESSGQTLGHALPAVQTLAHEPSGQTLVHASSGQTLVHAPVSVVTTPGQTLVHAPVSVVTTPGQTLVHATTPGGPSVRLPSGVSLPVTTREHALPADLASQPFVPATQLIPDGPTSAPARLAATTAPAPEASATAQVVDAFGNRAAVVAADVQLPQSSVPAVVRAQTTGSSQTALA